MHKTRNSLPEEQRTKLVEVLNRRLADSIDLLLQAKQAHWNVNGPQFLVLHTLFGQIAFGVEEYVDLLAERIVQLGGSADGTAYVVTRRTSLDRYPLEVADGNVHIVALATVLAFYGKTEGTGENRSDVIAIATHGHGGIEQWVMGSVTERVIGAATVPVLVVRPPLAMQGEKV